MTRCATDRCLLRQRNSRGSEGASAEGRTCLLGYCVETVLNNRGLGVRVGGTANPRFSTFHAQGTPKLCSRKGRKYSCHRVEAGTSARVCWSSRAESALIIGPTAGASLNPEPDTKKRIRDEWTASRLSERIVICVYFLKFSLKSLIVPSVRLTL